MKPKADTLSLPGSHKKVPPAQLKKKGVANRQATQSADSGTEAESALNLSGNHSEPLKDEGTRQAAAVEQAKLQNNPDALPVADFPTKRPAASATSNPVDADLKLPVRQKRRV